MQKRTNNHLRRIIFIIRRPINYFAIFLVSIYVSSQPSDKIIFLESLERRNIKKEGNNEKFGTKKVMVSKGFLRKIPPCSNLSKFHFSRIETILPVRSSYRDTFRPTTASGPLPSPARKLCARARPGICITSISARSTNFITARVLD